MSLSSAFKALSDPVRRKILYMLREKDMTAGEIAEKFDVSWPTISHHLSVLKQAGMILDERRGQNIYYSLNTSVFEEIVAFLMELWGKKVYDD